MGSLRYAATEQHRGRELLDEELQLHKRVLARDQSALLEWLRRIGGVVYSAALSNTGRVGLAEDMTEALFLEVWRHPERFHPANGPLTLQLIRRMNVEHLSLA